MTQSAILCEEVKAFVRDWILTPVFLNTLVFLHGQGERAATAAEISQSQHAGRQSVEAALAHFEAGRLIAGIDTGAERRYRYDPANAGLRSAVDRLVDAYNRIPVQLLRAVYDRASLPVRSLSEAFRLHKPK